MALQRPELGTYSGQSRERKTQGATWTRAEYHREEESRVSRAVGALLLLCCYKEQICTLLLRKLETSDNKCVAKKQNPITCALMCFSWRTALQDGGHSSARGGQDRAGMCELCAPVFRSVERVEMLISCRSSSVSVWKRRMEEPSEKAIHTPPPAHAMCATLTSGSGWTSNFCNSKNIYKSGAMHTRKSIIGKWHDIISTTQNQAAAAFSGRLFLAAKYDQCTQCSGRFQFSLPCKELMTKWEHFFFQLWLYIKMGKPSWIHSYHLVPAVPSWQCLTPATNGQWWSP